MKIPIIGVLGRFLQVYQLSSIGFNKILILMPCIDHNEAFQFNFCYQVIFVSRDNKDSRKVVGDTINMRAEMKERRRSLLKRSSQRIRSQLSKVSIGSVKSPNSIPVPKEKDEVKASWPQTILFPEGILSKSMYIKIDIQYYKVHLSTVITTLSCMPQVR